MGEVGWRAVWGSRVRDESLRYLGAGGRGILHVVFLGSNMGEKWIGDTEVTKMVFNIHACFR